MAHKSSHLYNLYRLLASERKIHVNVGRDNRFVKAALSPKINVVRHTEPSRSTHNQVIVRVPTDFGLSFVLHLYKNVEVAGAAATRLRDPSVPDGLSLRCFVAADDCFCLVWRCSQQLVG